MTIREEKPLQGLRVVAFESRLSDTMGGLIRLQGGEPILAPSMKEVPIENNPEALAFGEKLLRGEVDILIFLTGVGAKSLLEILSTRYPEEKILEAFRRVTVVPRGPKPIRFLREWKVPYALTVPEPNTWRELIETLDQHEKTVPLRGKKVAVQEYGVANPSLYEALKKRGAEVSSVPIYRWTLPDDLEPLKKAVTVISQGQAEVAIFTTAVQIHHALRVAETEGLKEKFLSALGRMAVASVGPDCTKALLGAGVAVDIEPESPKMGPLVLETAEKAPMIVKRKKCSDDCSVEVRSSVLGIFGAQDELRDSPFLRACRREKAPFTPVWLMRQAGRYMKDYREVREKHSFLELCKNKELITEVTVTAQEKISADAAIIFSDILIILEPMGLELSYQKGDGPKITNPVRTAADFKKLKTVQPRQSLSFALDSIRMTRAALKKNIPLIGFAGAPFTLVSYMIEGGASKTFSHTRGMMKDDPETWKALLTKIASETAEYLNAQAAAGCQALQLFDSWVGILTPDEYELFAKPYSKLLISRLDKSVPLIHFGTKTGPFIQKIAEAGGEVIGVDHETDLMTAWGAMGPGKAVQGNLDPRLLLGPFEEARKEAQKILDRVSGRAGHIFNLGHGVLPETPVQHVIDLVKFVHDYSAKLSR